MDLTRAFLAFLFSSLLLCALWWACRLWTVPLVYSPPTLIYQTNPWALAFIRAVQRTYRP
jgi:hypothetical protein